MFYTFYDPRDASTLRYEKPEGLSLTVPDMVLTRKQIVERHTRKIPVPGFEPIYMAAAGQIPDEMPPYGADRLEILAYMTRVNQHIQNLRNDLSSGLSRTQPDQGIEVDKKVESDVKPATVPETQVSG